MIVYDPLFLVAFDPTLFELVSNKQIHTNLNYDQMVPLTVELAVIERLKYRCLHFLLVAIDSILSKLAGSKDMHNIFEVFKFQTDQTTDC